MPGTSSPASCGAPGPVAADGPNSFLRELIMYLIIILIDFLPQSGFLTILKLPLFPEPRLGVEPLIKPGKFVILELLLRLALSSR